MSTGFKQTGKTQQLTTLGATTWAGPKVFNQVVGAIRVYNSGTNEALIAVADEPGVLAAPAALTDSVDAIYFTMAGNSELMLGPYTSPVYFSVAGTAGNKVQFTPGSGGLE